MNILNNVYKDYCLPIDLYNRIKKSIYYENRKDVDDLKGFVDEDLRNCGFVPAPAPSTHHFHSIHLPIHLIYSFSKQVDKAAKMTTSGDMYP